MKEYLLLLKALTKNNDMEMPEEGKKAKTYKVLGTFALLCIMIPCCVIVGVIVYVMTAAMVEAGGSTEGLELIIQLMSMFSVIFSIMVVFNFMYYSRDLEHLLPLPIKSSTLVAAKFTHVYLAESVMEFLILLSGFIGFLCAAGFKPVSTITAILGVALIPVLPLVYCGIFSLLVMAFFSKVKIFKNVDFMVGLVTIIFMGLFIMSFFKLEAVNVSNYIDSLKNSDNVFTSIMGKIFFTVPIFLKAIGENSIGYLLLFVLINVAAFAVLLALGNLLYLKGVYMISSTGRANVKNKEKQSSFRITKPEKAYFIKECKTLYRTPAYKKYCVNVNVMWPLMVVAMFYIPATKDFMNSFKKVFTVGHVLSDIMVLMFVIAISFFATAMNSIASTSFTREGNHFSFIKSAPIVYKKQIQIKALVSMIYSGITVLASTIILCLFMSCDILTIIYFCVIALMSVFICTYTGIMLDATHPKLDWEDEYGALRGNLNAFFNMAIAILIAIVLCVIGFCLFKYTMLSTFSIFVIYFVIFMIACFMIYRMSNKHAIRSIERDLYS